MLDQDLWMACGFCGMEEQNLRKPEHKERAKKEYTEIHWGTRPGRGMTATHSPEKNLREYLNRDLKSGRFGKAVTQGRIDFVRPCERPHGNATGQS